MTQTQKLLKDSAIARWTALILISLIMFSSYYFYDLYSSIKDSLCAAKDLTNTEYGKMYGAYSLLNAFGMAFLGGIILDKWGIRKTGTVFVSFLTIGVIITGYGSSSLYTGTSPLNVMIVGRILFGLGAETFYVVINKVIAKWFKGYELALAFAISLVFGRFGTAIAFFLSPQMLETSGLDTTVWIGVMFVIIAFIGYFVYMIFDAKLDKSAKGIDNDPEESFNIKDLKALLNNKSYIYITMLCVLFYSAVFPFMGYVADYLHNNYGFSMKNSGLISAILPLGTIIFTPLFGWFTDFKGKNATVMIYGSLILIGVHMIFSLTDLQPFGTLFLLGVAFSLVPAAMWPSVARIVPENRLGTAYGIMFSLQNWGLMLFPYFIGKVLDITNADKQPNEPLDYTYAILMLAFLGLGGLVFAFLLKKEDKKSGFGLELPNKNI